MSESPRAKIHVLDGPAYEARRKRISELVDKGVEPGAIAIRMGCGVTSVYDAIKFTKYGIKRSHKRKETK